MHPRLLAPPPGTAFGDSLKDMYVSLWCDPDLGGATDDLVGCDTTLALGYCYNATNNDLVYGSTPPAVGTDLLRGPAVRGGQVLGMTTFDKYINGTDPGSTDASYDYMRGLGADGTPIVNPQTGQPATCADPGDPVTGTGWLDANPADRRMMLTSGPFDMAPGDTQVIVAAILVGQGAERLGSVSALRAYDGIVQHFYDTGMMLPDTNPPPFSACPRQPPFWAAQCAAGPDTTLTQAQLAAIAGRVDQLSRYFDWPPGDALAGFCGVLQPPSPPDLRAQARREYAALLANLAAGLLAVQETNGHAIFFGPYLAFSCPGVGAASLGEMLALPDTAGPRRLFAAQYLDENPAHPAALAGVTWEAPFFGGGAGAAVDFFGSALDPAVSPDSFTTVRITFSHTATQKCYRYLRHELADGTSPPGGRVYQYGGFQTCDFQVRDSVTGQQLDAAFVERLVTDADGNPLPAEQQLASLDSTWGPTADEMGGREYLFVARTPYGDTPKAGYGVDGAPLEQLPWLYALWARLGAPGDVLDDGDAFQFSWGKPPDQTFETRLVRLDGQSLGDSAVAAAYADLASCLAGLNAGQGIGSVCDYTTPVLLSLIGAEALPDRIELSWYAGTQGLSATVERNDGNAWTVRGFVSEDGTGQLRFLDRDVTAGHRYGYRLRAAGFAAPVGEVWLEVPLELRLDLAGLRPNPATHGVTVHFTLPRRAPARLDLMDVSGRRVLTREVGGLGAGSHALRLDQDKAIPAGLYFLRLTQGDLVVTARGVVMR